MANNDFMNFKVHKSMLLDKLTFGARFLTIAPALSYYIRLSEYLNRSQLMKASLVDEINFKYH